MSAKELVEELVALVDNFSQQIGDWDYMKAMTMLQQLHQKSTTSEYAYVGYGASDPVLLDDYRRLTDTHRRLKSRNKTARKRWREQEATLRQQVAELMAEVEYLEQRHESMKVDLVE